jgi:hypothetical protein
MAKMSEDMKAVIRTLEDLDDFCSKAAVSGVLTGKPMTITLEKFKRPRTNDQNAKLHVLFRELAEHTGHSPEEIKEFFKQEFGPKAAIKLKVPMTHAYASTRRMVPVSTTLYSVDQLNEMIERVYQVGAQAGCQFEEAT